MKKWILAVGARPNFMKAASLLPLLRSQPGIETVLVHTGQHYSANMSDVFFKELGIPQPDIHLDVGSGTHSVQTAEIMKAFEKVLIDIQPQLVIVVGDVNSTLACALTAVKMHIKIAHIESGLRSFDRGMPEEINRILTDAISDFLFITESTAEKHLRREGIPQEKIFFVGNTMIDTLLTNTDQIQESKILNQLDLKEKEYAVLTLHRPSNVDKKEDLIKIGLALRNISTRLPIVFPAHPRTVSRMKTYHLPFDHLAIVPPLGYFDFMNLVSHSRCILTDSGGIQVEATVLGIPCITLRNTTEHILTVEQGTNRVVGTDPRSIENAFMEILNQPSIEKSCIPYWDGKASERIINALMKELIDRPAGGQTFEKV
jgi:UDP-N-acetylglucosamine 2-epimerase (non-hydrolysing)